MTIPDIYIINLATRPDRLREISSHLASLGLAGIRVEAIEGSTLEEHTWSLIDSKSEAYWRAHLSAFGLIAQGQMNNALVLEDDAVLAGDRNWPALLQELDAYMSRSSLDVLQLGFAERVFPTRLQQVLVESCRAIQSGLKRLYDFIFRQHNGLVDKRWGCLHETPQDLQLIPDHFGDGSHCYLISRRAAGSLLHFNSPAFISADKFFYAVALSAPDYLRLKIAKVRRNLAVQRARAGRR